MNNSVKSIVKKVFPVTLNQRYDKQTKRIMQIVLEDESTFIDVGGIKPLTASDLMDGVLPQSPVFSDYINKQLNMRMTKDLENMSHKLNIGSKNKLLSESNDKDYDIVIDDNLFEEGDND